jgi:hypothetical protein
VSTPAGAALSRAAVSRRAVAITVGGALGALAAACSTKYRPSNVPLNRHNPSAPQDAALLAHLLDRERYAIAAYSAAIPLLTRPAARAARQFLAHELAHASELEGLIEQAGGKPNKPPAFYDLGSPRGERQLLELLHAAERWQTQAYVRAVRQLQPARLRAAAAAILANEAQHVAVLRGRLGLEPVPSALFDAGE